MVRVSANGVVSEAFTVTNRVKQDCVLTPTLFSLMYSAMLMNAYREERPGIRIAYRMDGRFLNQRRTHSQSRVSIAIIKEILFTDDCALKATTKGDMPRSMDIFAATCANFGLHINTEKRVVMHQTLPNTIYNAARVNVNDGQLKSVDAFTYLGSNISRSTKIDDEVAHRIVKASQAFGRMQNVIHAVNATSVRESALSDTLRRNATIIQQYQRLRQRTSSLPTLRRTTR
ncbi:unnamed protein product [Schistocephalus solidus]|uniref:Reverse transcriptase domain-containing protein n=1 Tax=Schistocephalus solidus TaxID=70667 RepID=A0A183S866_SCHSO|nr:unnamed protein product [Schistocephalus solidus]